jgi:hypothetical protein
MADEADDEISLYETPSEFMTSMAITKGICNGQSILRAAQGFLCQCSCGWHESAPSKAAGLNLARAHTGTT